jgi:oligoendopeptidase F
MNSSQILSGNLKSTRSFVPENLVVNSWDDLKPFYQDLTDRNLSDEKAFFQWLKDWSEVSALVSEDAGWRYIKMTINTADKTAAERYDNFVVHINPELEKTENVLNNKLVSSPYFSTLKDQNPYRIFFKSTATAIKLFREENVPLSAKINQKTSEYGAVTGAMQVSYEGKELTMQQASQYLKKQDEKVRKEVYDLMYQRRKQDTDKLDDLFDELLALRHQTAVNAGFENYRDYKFEAMNRFDYTPQDCFDFHQSIEEEIVPILKKIHADKLKKLGKDKFRPWDLSVDPEGKEPLKPFEDGKELIEKSITVFNKINPLFGEILQTMNRQEHLDLDSKANKAPGGYNYPLYESNLPFIFMNAVGSHSDLITMMHEGGHAIHSVLTKDLELTEFKNLTSEVAELASMSMELISMQHWNEFYSNPDELNRAKKDQLERMLDVLPWVATVDSFQHWLYTHPNHTREERQAEWTKTLSRFSTGMTDWTGYEDARTNSWHKQLHIFEVPFYYIEYGMAQLGAIAIWKNFMNHPEQTLNQYIAALSLGYTKSIPEIYKTAGIEFNFSSSYVKSLAEFVSREMRG